jgi:hypothetical protein
MTFSKYIDGYQNCQVYIANIIIFDCGFDYQAFKWNYLVQNSGQQFNNHRLLVYKQPGGLYKFRREIDEKYELGTGDFFVLKEDQTLNNNNGIDQLWAKRGGEVAEIPLLTFNFRDKKVIDTVIFKHRDQEGYRIYFVVLVTEQRDILLIRHARGDRRVYTDSDIRAQVKLDYEPRHIRGYYTKTSESTTQQGFVVIERAPGGAQYMRRYVVTHDAEWNPSMS